jgi:hypothetical protein
MRGLRKYLAILFILTVYPMVHIIASSFIVLDDNSIYKYVPEDSDLVVEINCRNFVQEILYQKVYNEEYFNNKLFPPDQPPAERPDFNIGIDPFSKIVLFREVWSEQQIWIAVIPCEDQNLLKAFIAKQHADAKVIFNEDFAFVQLMEAQDQEKLDAHLKEIAEGKMKSFANRVNLAEAFDPSKEINIYLVHESLNDESRIIEGYLNMDFLADEIKVDGKFIPVSGFESYPSIAYAINDSAAISIRSSLDVLNTIYWFTEEKIDRIPKYTQLAIDHSGINFFHTSLEFGYDYPIKSYPDVQIHFDFSDPEPWRNLLEHVRTEHNVTVDSVGHLIATSQGTFFQYEFSDNHFRLMRGVKQLPAEAPGNVYFAMHADMEALLDNCIFQIDEENPPVDIIDQKRRELGVLASTVVIEELKLIATMSTFDFTLTLDKNSELIAEGHGIMKEKNGHSVIESMTFGTTAALFIKNNLIAVEDVHENTEPF